MSQRFPGGFLTQSPPTPSASNTTGVWTLDQQEQLKQSGQWPPNGPFFIEDLFSTWLYAGQNTATTITNGIDLAGKGGLVWTKGRTGSADNHLLIDTVRGVNKPLRSNEAGAQYTETTLTAFNSNGYNITGGNGDINLSGRNYVSWTFREQPKFFAIASWTGDGVAGRVIPHNLGSVPGCILVKRVSGGFGEDWQVYHRSLSASQNLVLNTSAAAATSSPAVFGTVTSTGFQLSNSSAGNSSGYPYIAYVFAHNAGGFGNSGTDNVISCGSYTGTGGNTVVNLGYEPQWILFKNTSSSSSFAGWYLHDTMRGLNAPPSASGTQVRLSPNTSEQESVNSPNLGPQITATGFSFADDSTGYNNSGSTYIYIAIRRGPMRTPTTGTSVFSPQIATQTLNSVSPPAAGFPVDSLLFNWRNAGYQWQWVDRLKPTLLATNSTAAESSQNFFFFDSQTGVREVGNYESTSSPFVFYNFKRAPGFFDEVCYTGTGSNLTLPHNLTVAPELLIAKVRSTGSSWGVSTSTDWTKYLLLNSTNAQASASLFGTPDATNFYPTASGGFSGSGNTYVAYLFASCPGVSRVGSYTGTGTTQTINCGFTGGARFVMIKRTDSTGDWYVWDTARGMIPANDPYLLLNSTAAEVTGTDFVDTAATGFEITSTAPAAINASGGTFIFLAIA